MDERQTWTDCDEAGDYVVPNVLSPRDLVFRPDNIDETVLHTFTSPCLTSLLPSSPGGRSHFSLLPGPSRTPAIAIL